ncbi:MAG: VgrG-related protein, partial [Acidimicrobiia bacterium]
MTTTAVRQTTRPQVTVKVKGDALAESLASALVRVVIDHTLGRPESFMLTFLEPAGDTLRLVPTTFVLGATVDLSMGQDESSATKLLSGEVTAIESEFDGERGTRTTVRGAGLTHRLLRGRKTKAFKQKSYSAIATEICQAAGLETSGITATTGTHEVVIQANRNDWEFLAGLAAESAFMLRTEGKKLYFGPPPAPDSAPSRQGFRSNNPLELAWGDNLLRLSAGVRSDAQVKEVVVRSWDPQQKKALVGKGPAASALVKLDGDGHDPAALAKLCGNAGFQSGGVPYATQADATSAAQGMAARLGGEAYDVEGIARGNPALVAGKAVRLSMVGAPFEGKYTLTATRHVLEAGRPWVTHFRAGGLGDRSLLGLTSAGGAPLGGPIGAGGPGPATIAGVVPALVTNVKDTANLGRVKVKFPWLDEQVETDWIRLATPNAGPSRGLLVLPEVDDEVLVAFEHGDLRRPYVVGALWNGKDKPPARVSQAVDANSGTVNERSFTSRKGHY